MPEMSIFNFKNREFHIETKCYIFGDGKILRHSVIVFLFISNFGILLKMDDALYTIRILHLIF